MEEGQLSHEAAAEVMKQLERKDEEDKATALAAVEKVAKKYKKAAKRPSGARQRLIRGCAASLEARRGAPMLRVLCRRGGGPAAPWRRRPRPG